MHNVPTIVFVFALALSAGVSHAATIIFDDDFNDTASASQADLIGSVDTGSWGVNALDGSSIQTDTNQFLELSRGLYDYTAIFTQAGSAAGGGTITMDLMYREEIHDFNTVSFLEGTTELFRIEVQTDDGSTGNGSARIKLVGDTVENIDNGIREWGSGVISNPNRTFTFTLDDSGVDLSITGDGITGSLDKSVDYDVTPIIGPDRIRFFKYYDWDSTPTSAPHRSTRGQLRVDNILADFNTMIATPEPSSFALLLVGLVRFCTIRRRRRRRTHQLQHGQTKSQIPPLD